ncbi:hypothetical protein I317_02925 [Kwoniella heveanensis CBS 569]|nr:hypothetical protein I317_02925 [Kwoniella heveanensis CBS 569]
MQLSYILVSLLAATSIAALSLPRRPGIFPNMEERSVEQVENRALGSRNLEDIDRRYSPTRTHDESRSKRVVEDAVFEDEEESSFDSRVLQLSSRRGVPKALEL